jgi:hypothetical protein
MEMSMPDEPACTVPTVSLVVLRSHRGAATPAVLESIRELDFPDDRLEVIIVDGAARNEAAARNAGGRRASGTLLLFCDDDLRLGADHLTLVAEDLATHPDALVSGWWDEFRHEARDLWGDARDPLVAMRLLTASDLAMHASVFSALGGFDERFPVAGAEAQDLSIRARMRGFSLLTDRRLQCRRRSRPLEQVH